MKVVHISYSDKRGGAAIAAYRLNVAFNRAGIESSMLVLDRCSDDSTVIKYKCKFQKLKWVLFCTLSKILDLFIRPFAAYSVNLWGYDCSNNEAVRNADVVYIHWVNSHFLSLKSIRNILKLNKPTVFYMHDMWHITGGCHHSLECEKYESECAECPMLHDHKGSKIKHDISYLQFKLKKKYFSKYKNIIIATPSKWLHNKVNKSSLFKETRSEVFNNLLDTEMYCPQDVVKVREKLNLPLDKKLILFGADNIHSPYKGWKYLEEAIKHFDKNWTIVLFGSADETEVANTLAHPYISMGAISGEDNLIDLFSACDAFVCPSLVDNYPNVILEASSCELPTVAFSVGGIPEMIDHKQTGYLTDLGDVTGLIEGIRWVLDNKKQAGQKARARVKNLNSYSRVRLLK